MKVSYKKLWYLCVEREIGKAELRKRTGLSSATFTKLRCGQEVNLSALSKTAKDMNCIASDMMDFLLNNVVIKQEESEKSFSIMVY